MGRPKKVRDSKDDGKAHRIWEFTDYALFDSEGEIIPDRWQRYLRLMEPDMCKKLIAVIELCPTTGRKHLQGRLACINPHKFEFMRKLFSHCEVTACTDDWSYFAKLDSKPLIDVDHRRQGKRSIFETQKEMITSGCTVRDCIALPGANMQSIRSAEILQEYLEPPRAYGDVKPYFVPSLDAIKEKHLYRPPVDGEHLRFWTGYDGHEAVVIDCTLHHIDASTLRAWIGPHPFLVNTKRGCRQALYKRIYVIRPPECFQSPPECHTTALF